MANNAAPDRLVSMDILSFCDRAKGLLSASQADFVRFVLTGRHSGIQAVIDPIQNRLLDDEDLRVVRDYDSLLGISKHILVEEYLEVYPLAKREDTLTRNIHIEFEFGGPNGPFTEKVHKIPNLCIAKWGRKMIRVLIPGLHEEHGSPYLTQDNQKIFYEKGFLPAVQELCEERAAEWPATYDDEMFRARGHNGTLSFQTKTIPRWRVKDLGTTIRACLFRAGIPWGKGIVFLHQIRGVKQSTYHELSAEAATEALDDFLFSANLNLMQMHSHGKWWIDVGIEVGSDDKNCLAWRTDSHVHMVQHVCNLSDENAQRITSVGSSKYTRDLTSHLPEVSGCRITPGIRAQGRYRVAYLQMYCTDKSLTYRQDQGHYGKFVTCSDVLKGKADDFIAKLYSLYINAIDDHNSLARMELRIPLQFADKVFLHLDQDTVRHSLVSFPGVEWWSLRAYRAKAIQLTLKWQAEGDSLRRAKWPALLLTAGCTWLLNGLHSAPDNGPSCRKLMSTILPHIERQGADPMLLAYGNPTENSDVDTDDEDGEGETLPAYPYGLVYFRGIRVGEQYPVPRLDDIYVQLPAKDFRYFFGVHFDDIGEEFFRSGLIRPSNPRRTHNKVRRTTAYIQGDDPLPNLFDLESRNIFLPPPPRDGGSDVASEEAEEIMTDDEDNADTALTKLWLQFIQDITQKCSNRQRGEEESYCKLSIEQRGQATDDLYKNPRLSDFFNDCQWKTASGNEWSEVFDRLFPLRNRLTGKVQNYRSTRYYPQWEKIKDRAGNEKTVELFRKALKSRFDKLYWVPCAQSDRIWLTKPMYPRFQKFINEKGPAPWVIVKKGRPQWEYD